MKVVAVASILAVALGSSQAACAPSYAYPRQSNASSNAVPSYVKTYGISQSQTIFQAALTNVYTAPYIYLHSQEAYFPADLATHIANTVPYLNFTATDYADNISNLGSGAINTGDTYLTVGSDKVINNKPQFLYGQKPDATGTTAQMPIVVVDKGNGLVDAFYFTFYSYV